MKTPHFLLVAAASLSVMAVNLHSQAPAPRPPMEQLKAMKVKNVTLLEQQKATLLKLEEVAKQAEQIRFLSKRS